MLRVHKMLTAILQLTESDAPTTKPTQLPLFPLQPAAVLLPAQTMSSPLQNENSNWIKLVDGIYRKQPEAIEELYSRFGRGIRLLIARQLGQQDLDDHVHDVFLITIDAIQNGELRNPECLPGFIRTITRRRIANQISQAVWKRNREVDSDSEFQLPSTRQNPEEVAVDSESIRIMQAVLLELHPRDREILSRFYLSGQSADFICHEMDLTEVQFRLLKSRAKSRFAEYGRRKLAKRANSLHFQRLCLEA
jgi:RNA polymerase sigma-70 factor (ECF subfamily)